MHHDTTTGSVFFGRWAAPVNAGLVPPDPFPLEKLLFCAGCGQQFMGAHRNGNPEDTARIAACDHFPHCICPPEDPRLYGTFCNCRPAPFPAFAVELRIHTEAHLRAFDPHEPVPGITKAHYTVLALRFFTRVDVGTTTDHMTFTNRI